MSPPFGGDDPPDLDGKRITTVDFETSRD